MTMTMFHQNTYAQRVNIFILISQVSSRKTLSMVDSAETDEEDCPAGWVNAHDEGCINSAVVKTPWILAAAIYAYKYYCQGCFMFLSDQPKLTWIDASYACEQVMLVGSEELNLLQRLNLLFGEQSLAGPNGLKQFTWFINSGWWLSC